ncbi:hypothetical protein [Pannonibacter sp.]|uniref:hypothetical protein n=1 Tax=Pannonibacter sp. TaxID=1906786 RepID=UPI003F6FC875
MRKAFASAILAAGVVACSSLTTAGLRAVASLDPVETDPAQLQAAIGVDDAFRLRTGDAKLTISYRVDGAEVPVVSEEFKLEITAANGSEGLQADRGEAIFIARIAETDLSRARDAQARIKAFKQSKSGSGDLSVGVSSGCLTKPLPEKVPLRTFIRSEQAGKFVQLTRIENILDMLTADQVRKVKQDFPAC